MVTALHRESREPGDACVLHIPLIERELRFGRCYKSGDTKKRKLSIHSHFPKDRKCDECLRTKITRVPCRRRHEGSFPRAEKFGDLITGDHKVLNEGSESRNNHRYPVVVQDLATQWIQSFPCNIKNFTGDGEKFTKVSGAVAEAKSYSYGQFYWNMAKSCEELSWSHRTTTPHRSEMLNGVARRATEGDSSREFNYVPREESFPTPLKFFLCHQVNSYRFGCCTRKTS